jgi:hypothetical protein
MENKKFRQMQVDVARHIEELSGNALNDRLFIVWWHGPCLVAGGNFLWPYNEVVSIKGKS